MTKLASFSAFFLSFTVAGCFTTSLVARDTRVAPTEHEHRQWFTLAGAVALSEPVGEECARTGVATAYSESATLDVLLSIGLAVAGGALATQSCKQEDPSARASCVSLLTGVGPLLLASRTVRYHCAMATPKKSKVTADE